MNKSTSPASNTRSVSANRQDDILTPLDLIIEEEVMPIASTLGLSRSDVELLLKATENVPREKRPGVWKFPRDGGIERFIDSTAAQAKRCGKALAIISLDLLNIGGMNASRSETWVNSHVIDPLLDLALAACRELVAGVDGAWFQLFHYGGGDEYVVVIYGIDDNEPKSINGNTLPAHDITRAFDTLVRTAAVFARSQGLDLVPHGKKWWRIGYWGTGILYGIALWDPSKPLRKAEELLDDAFVWVQQFKRGLKGKEGNPLDLSIWEQCRRMVWMPWCILYKLFGIELRRKRRD